SNRVRTINRCVRIHTVVPGEFDRGSGSRASREHRGNRRTQRRERKSLRQSHLSALPFGGVAARRRRRSSLAAWKGRSSASHSVRPPSPSRPWLRRKEFLC